MINKLINILVKHKVKFILLGFILSFPLGFIYAYFTSSYRLYPHRSMNNEIRKSSFSVFIAQGWVFFWVYLALVVIVTLYIEKLKEVKLNQKYTRETAVWQKEYEEVKLKYYRAYNKIKDESNVRTNISVKIDSFPYYMWYENGCIRLFPHQIQLPQNMWDRKKYNLIQQGRPRYLSFANSEKIELPCTIDISLNQIEYFAKSGEIYRENKISGGGGGGSSIGGAIIGGVLAGETGAIIGSRKKINEVQSKLIIHDDRHTILKLKSTSYKMDIADYDTLNELIPQKEFSIVQELKKQNIISQSSQKSISVTEQIKELAKLRDDGILTEEEFNTKKTQLLSKI